MYLYSALSWSHL